MKKVSIISPIYENIFRLPEVSRELVTFFKDKYDFEIFCYYKGTLPKDLIEDYRFNFLKIENNQNFNECIVDGFDRVDGDCVIIADINNTNYMDYITKLLVEWEAKAQIVLVKKNIKSGFWGKIKQFFVNIGNKITDMLLSFAGLNCDLHAYKNFQLFSKEVVQVIKSFPQKNYYLRNFDCWVDYRVSIIYSNDKVHVKNKIKNFTNDLIYCLISFVLMLTSVLLVSVGKAYVDKTAQPAFVFIGAGLSVGLTAFSLYFLYRWIVYKKTLINHTIK